MSNGKENAAGPAADGGELPNVGAPGSITSGGSAAKQTHDYTGPEKQPARPVAEGPAPAAPGVPPATAATVATPVGVMATSTGTDAAGGPQPLPAGPTNATASEPEAARRVGGDAAARKVKVATTWLEGCSGCHMSFLDMDERLIELSEKIDLVYSPLVDNKECPPDVDVTLVEGAIATDEDVRKIRHLRAKSRVLISLGDCAVTGNVPSMRNSLAIEDVYDRAYVENAAIQKQRPATKLPVLLERVRPVHELVKVDVHIPGCPPPADAIHYVLTELLNGRTPDISKVTRFGR